MSLLRHTARWLGTQLLRIADNQPTTNAPSEAAQGAAPDPDSAIIYVLPVTTGPLRQGEILSDVTERRRSFQSLTLATPEIEEIRHPYCIIASQDCDLEQDYDARNGGKTSPDKLIPNILLLQAVTRTELIGALALGSDIRKPVTKNKDDRYQILERVVEADDVLKKGLPSLGVDFKRYFTVPTDELYAQVQGSGARRRTQLNSNYLERFNQRFAGYLSRVALLREHRID
jgi:hypothetical protein